MKRYFGWLLLSGFVFGGLFLLKFEGNGYGATRPEDLKAGQQNKTSIQRKTEMKQTIFFNNPFEKEGNWYKGCIHMHTTNSDGVLSPALMVAEYRKAGYDFVVITDHCKRTDVKGLSDEKMLVIAGEETNPAGVTSLGCDSEFLALGIKEPITLPNIKNPGLVPQSVIDQIKQAGGVAVLAHPNFSHMMPDDILPLEGLLGIEIYNPVFGPGGRSYALVHWDQMLESGKKVFGFAGDDSHGNVPVVNPFTGYIMVKAPARTEEAIMESIKKGCFYSSNGPVISDVALTEDSVSVVTSDVKVINFVGDVSFPLGTFPVYGDNFINTATYRFVRKGREKYLRIECTDANGRNAWTNPIFFK